MITHKKNSFIGVIFPNKWSKTYTYVNSLDACVGQIVLAPIKNKFYLGVVGEYASELDKALRIKEKYDAILSEKFLKFIKIASEYNMYSFGEFLKLGLQNVKPKYSDFYEYNHKTMSISVIIKVLGKNKFKKLFQSGEIRSSQNILDPKINLRKDQIAALEKIKFTTKTVLLKGITGSGKTNVYLSFIAEKLAKNRQCLIIMPEISLTENFIDVIETNLGISIHLWNHSIDSDAKDVIFSWALSGKPGLLLGSRSAIWLPFKNLGCIIVDEEHDSSYKQDSSPHYNGRDMAVLRSNIEQCKCILVSATPSLETWHNVESGKYDLVELQGSQKLKVQIVKRSNSCWFSPELLEKIAKCMEQKKQSIIFLNKRGFASMVMCSECLAIKNCKNCSANVLIYKNKSILCSYCGLLEKITTCGKCGQKNWDLRGIGIERLSDDLKNFFPHAKIDMISSDSEDKGAILQNLVEDKLDILVGTQIIAKGYNFPNLCLVGVIQADQGLSSGDFRNTENIYQLLTQVKGRCGRFDLDGDVVLQTNNPDSPLLRAIGENDFEKWAAAELSLRKANMLPPFYRLIRIIVASKFAIKSCSDANYLYEQLKEKISRITIYPPCPTELKKYKSTFRYVILVRYSAGSYPQKDIMAVLSQIKLTNRSKIIPDVDPYRFF